MATPTSPIGFSDIYSEANGTTPGSATSLKNLTYQQSYFTGPNGNNTISFNAWGQNQNIDGIYAVQAIAPSPVSFNDYRNVSYFYDQTNTQISLYIVNNGPTPPTGDFNFTMYYMDSSLTYNYNVGGAFVPGGGNSFGPNEISGPGTPLIYGCNWKLQIDSNPFYGGGNFLNLFINGNLLINNDPIPPTFPAPVFWDYNVYGNEYMTLNEPTGGATGSRIEIVVN